MLLYDRDLVQRDLKEMVQHVLPDQMSAIHNREFPEAVQANVPGTIGGPRVAWKENRVGAQVKEGLGAASLTGNDMHRCPGIEIVALHQCGVEHRVESFITVLVTLYDQVHAGIVKDLLELRPDQRPRTGGT